MHLVQTMAYVGQEPWHGLGNRLTPNQPIEVWADRAGMNWTIESSEVRFVTGSAGIGAIHAYPEQKVLYRSDNKAPLSVVSSRYQVVQPREILEFYRDLTEISGLELETAGVLKEGRKLWALAKTGHFGLLKGKDKIGGYLLLATACDGTYRAIFVNGKPEGTEETYDPITGKLTGRAPGSELRGTRPASAPPLGHAIDVASKIAKATHRIRATEPRAS